MARTRAMPLVSQLRRDARESLYSIANVANTENFCDELFPVPADVVDHMLEIMKVLGLYDGKRWAFFPDGASDSQGEYDMYSPFTQVANAIHQIIRDVDGSEQKHGDKPGHKNLLEAMYGDKWTTVDLVECIWDTLSKDTPKARGVSCHDVRPDISCSVPFDKEHLNEEITALVNDLHVLTQAYESSSPEARKDLENQLDTAESKFQFHSAMKNYWLRQHGVVELTCNRDSEDIKTVTIQAIGGMQMILREQLNRRFVFGLTLCRDQLGVWLTDRSGLLGIKTGINIHSDPKRFIQILAGFSILSAERLGWDRSMQLYDSRTDQCLQQPPYRTFNAPSYGESVYDTHWIIEMPSKGNPGNRERFLTVRCISGSDEVCGRATLVWEAVKFNERHHPRKIYVLKQAWRPDGDLDSAEATIYKMMESTEDEDRRFLPSVYSSEDVQDESGYVDDTESLIRHDLEVEKHRRSPSPPSWKDLWRLPPKLPVIITAIEGKDIVFEVREATIPTSRVRTRILMEDYGWSLKFFLDQLEFLCLMRDGIKGHRFAYVNEHLAAVEEDQRQVGKGVLHRDVSYGNLLICPQDISEDGSPTEGRLIDFDHAKLSNGFSSINIPIAVDSDVSSAIVQLMSFSDHPPPSTEVIEKVCVRVSEISPLQSKVDRRFAVACYIGEAMNLHRNGMGTEMNNLVKQLPARRPIFAGRRPKNEAGTGTMPFMSAAVLTQSRVRPSLERYTLWSSYEHFHDALHDIESFFWVFTYLCMTREGPGGERRNELKLTPGSEPSEETKTLCHVVDCLFGDENEAAMIENKTMMLQKHNALEEVIIPNISPYFRNLIPLLRRWWALILHTHQFQLFEYDIIHDLTLELFDEAIADLQKTPPEFEPELRQRYENLSNGERERRRLDLQRIRECFRHSGVLTGPTEPHEETEAGDHSGGTPELPVGQETKGRPLSEACGPAERKFKRARIDCT